MTDKQPPAPKLERAWTSGHIISENAPAKNVTGAPYLALKLDFLLDSSRFTCATAQIVQFRTSHIAATLDRN